MVSKEYGKLIRAITANVNYFISSKIEKYGIKKGQYEYFLQVYTSPGINQLELARRLNVGKGSVTKALKILEEGGFLRREIDGNDRRNIRCYISANGEKIVEDLMKVRAHSENRLFKGLNENDKEVFYKCLNTMHQNSMDLLV